MLPIGDADGGWLLPLDLRAPDDARGIFSTAAVVFRRPDFAWAAGELAPETCWLLGPSAAETFDSLEPRPPQVGPPGHWNAAATSSCGQAGARTPTRWFSTLARWAVPTAAGTAMPTCSPSSARSAGSHMSWMPARPSTPPTRAGAVISARPRPTARSRSTAGVRPTRPAPSRGIHGRRGAFSDGSRPTPWITRRESTMPTGDFRTRLSTGAWSS